jgi:WD40 repeat protein
MLDNAVRLWDAEGGSEIRAFSGHSNTVWSAAFSPDGKRIVSGSADSTIKLWNLAGGGEIAQFIGFDDDEWLCVTPDGYYNASSGGDQYLNVRVDRKVYGMDRYRKFFYKPHIVTARLSGKAG